MLFQSSFVFSSLLAAAAASAVGLLFPDGILYVYVVAEDSKRVRLAPSACSRSRRWSNYIYRIAARESEVTAADKHFAHVRQSIEQREHIFSSLHSAPT